MEKRILIAMFLILSACPFSYAEGWPTKPFESVVVTTAPTGSTTTTTINDGKGHVRIESKTGANKSVVLMDYPKKESIVLMDAQKMAMKNKLTSSEDNNGTKGKDLGKKVINGHPCHGELFEQGGVKTEVWTGEDINSMVQTITITPQGKTVTNLKSYSANPPAMPSFAIPTGYKVISTK